MRAIKIFLVEDETIIREGLRDGIPWEQYGYEFAGEASDGEQALPMIRQLKPDVLITDIRMPFMDGLELSRLIARELPATRIIILSGYDDFEYARQAIGIGVEQYLLKPITRAMLSETLQETARKIRAEQEQENYLETFRTEMQEYEQFSRRHLFEQMIAGELTAGEIYERAGELGMKLHAGCFNILLYTIQDRHDTARMTSEPVMQLSEKLTAFFEGKEEYLLIRQNLSNYAVLIRSDQAHLEEVTQACVQAIRMNARQYENQVDWYLATGRPVNRLSFLPECYAGVSRSLSHRYLFPHRHLLSAEDEDAMSLPADEKTLKGLDISRIGTSIINGFLTSGQDSETEEFVRDYLDSVAEAARSTLFSQYLVLNIRYSVIAFLEALGGNPAEILKGIEGLDNPTAILTVNELAVYMRQMLKAALAFRDEQNRNQEGDLIRRAVAYIDENYSKDSLSLKDAAGHVNVSANYFSAVFSQEMKKTFVEYVTEKRMERARELLRTSDMKTAQIAAEVGYRDPHYFSFVFRKTQGMSPREYRTNTRPWQDG